MSWWTGSPGGSSLWSSRPPRRGRRGRRGSRGRARGRRGGFTLLEVIVAFTILSVALVGLLQAFATGMHGLSAAKTSATAVMHARSKLDQVGQAIQLEDGETSGEFDDGYAWRVRIAEAQFEDQDQVAGSLAVAFEVEVRVNAPQGRAVTLRTLRLGAPE